MRSAQILREMVLLRNDPALVEAAREQALGGDADAQYALGLIYAEGRGIAEDPVEAYAWLSLAVMQGDRDAETLRYVVAEQMTGDECGHGLRRAAEYESLIERINRRPATA